MTFCNRIMILNESFAEIYIIFYIFFVFCVILTEKHGRYP